VITAQPASGRWGGSVALRRRSMGALSRCGVCECLMACRGVVGHGCRPVVRPLVGRPAAPVIWSQVARRMVVSARCGDAVIRWRWGRKWGEMPWNADRNRWAAPAERKPFIARSHCLAGWLG
jgi:hypothetical protein